MKITLLLVLLSLCPSVVFANPNKLDLMLQDTDDDAPTIKAMLGKSVAGSTDGQYVEVLVRSDDPDLTATSIEEFGGKIQAIVGDILVVNIERSFLEKLSDREEVQFIEASKQLSFKNDTSRIHTKVALAQAGTITGSALTGKDVIVGVVDDSFDYGNDDFKDASGNTRVQFIRQYNTSTGKYVTCVKSEIDDGTCNTNKITDRGQGYYHGTHVTGIAASSNTTYKGVAPEADIMFAFNSSSNGLDTSGDMSSAATFSGAVCSAASAIMAGADLLNKPAVINLSLGTSMGAHDDTSLLEKCLNNLTSNGTKAGRVIVNAAGNENVNSATTSADVGGIHSSFNVSAGTPKAFRFGILRDLSNFGAGLADIWFSQGDNCTVEVKAYRFSAASATSDARTSVGPTSVTSDTTAANNSATDNTVKLFLGTNDADGNNSRPHALLTIQKASGASWSSIVTDAARSKGYVFDIVVRATSGTCTGNMWLYPDQTAFNVFYKNIDGVNITGSNSYTLADGDSNKTTTIPGTASSLITVGSFMQEKQIGSGTACWSAADGNTYCQTTTSDGTGGTVDNVSLFSSLGPTGEISNSRTKPDVLAPGEPVLSTLARGASVATVPNSIRVDAGKHLKLEGTSMASPHVTGIVALLLQYNNTLTANDIKTLLKSTADVVSGPANTVGSGKVNIQAALASISANTSGFSGTRDTCTDDIDASTGSFNSSSSCGSGGSSGGGCGGTLVPANNARHSMVIIFLACAPLALLTFRRCSHPYQ